LATWWEMSRSRSPLLTVFHVENVTRIYNTCENKWDCCLAIELDQVEIKRNIQVETSLPNIHIIDQLARNMLWTNAAWELVAYMPQCRHGTSSTVWTVNAIALFATNDTLWQPASRCDSYCVFKTSANPKLKRGWKLERGCGNNNAGFWTGRREQQWPKTI
jgi:hypothetical protein